MLDTIQIETGFNFIKKIAKLGFKVSELDHTTNKLEKLKSEYYSLEKKVWKEREQNPEDLIETIIWFNSDKMYDLEYIDNSQFFKIQMISDWINKFRDFTSHVRKFSTDLGYDYQEFVNKINMFSPSVCRFVELKFPNSFKNTKEIQEYLDDSDILIRDHASES